MVVGITCGDPSGLGPETIESCLKAHRFEGVRFRVYGNGPWLEQLRSVAIADCELVSLTEQVFELGKPEEAGARLAVMAMERSAADCAAGETHAVVTGPISKALCAKVGYVFPGQTEFYANRWNGEPTMAFVGERLRLCLATWHIPLSAVPASLSEDVFKRAIRSGIDLARKTVGPQGRVLVCGLNPHAGEAGLLGREEVDFLDRWVSEMRAEHAFVEGCVPGDTAFARAMNGGADVVVALYHDQGLAPFKAVDFDSGVNVTLGLPHLRVSPDHGTGFDIAGKGVASETSMISAIRLACRWLGAKCA